MMFTRLIESQQVREKGAGARIVSLTVHAAIVSAAVYATAVAAPAPVEFVTVNTLPVYRDPAPVHGGAHAAGRRCTELCIPVANTPVIDLPIDDPSPGPAINLADPVFGGGRGEEGTPLTSGSANDPGSVFEIVERPAAARPGNPRPGYPAILRDAHIEGSVSVRFVVDTTGRVEPASIVFESSGERLFEESVRRALLASRFVPAETQGRRVRMLVRQDFAFRITP